VATPPETIETPAADEGRRLDPRLIALIAAIAVVLLAIVYFLFLRGGEEPAPPPAPAPAPAAESPPPVETDRGKKPVETFEVFAAKDPFEPAVSAAAAGDGDGAGPAPGDGGAPSDGTDGTTPGRGGGGREETIGGHRVRLVDAFPNGRRAQIQVDGVVYTVDEGEEFASNFRLISVSGRCATMLFGDDEFTLCEGEEVLK
jgi:hypothetical protein